VKGRCRYRYYVSRALIRGSTAEGERGWRVPGPELERAVAIAARSILDGKPAILEALHAAGMEDTDVNQVFTLAAEWRKRLLSETGKATALVGLVEKAILTDEGIRLGLNIPVQCGGPSGASLRSGSEGTFVRLLLDAGVPDPEAKVVVSNIPLRNLRPPCNRSWVRSTDPSCFYSLAPLRQALRRT
jgi:hypothetical protein